MELKKIYRYAHKYGLEVEFVNEDMLKLYSKKYDFDSWLICCENGKLQLLHKNRYGSDKNKCRYHLQKEVKTHNWKWLLQKIKDHNNYTVKYKWAKNTNMVDKILGEYNRSRYVG
ncbi:MAG: hypothetical protein RSH78_00065 [Bacilli bacterium]